MGRVSTMDKNIYKIINFVAMSDGGVYSYGKDNYAFAMNMLAKHMDFLEWVKTQLEHFTSVTISQRKLETDWKRQPQVRIQTKAHPYFKKIREHLYIDNYKGLWSHYLKFLDEEALAILYMCDGCLGVEKPNSKKGLVNESYNVTLNLKRLSEGDTLMLKKAIKNKFDIEFNICRSNKYYFLRLRAKDISKFMTLITPYVFPSFKYKLRTINP